MARPKKDNADYFSHDKDMRNDPKIKAIRKKFGFKGYAVWCYLLETLTDSDFFECKWDELHIELLAGDFDCESKDLLDIVSYCEKLNLLHTENNTLMCFTLRKRFESLLSKRKRDRNRVIATENPHSKVKESKVKETKEKESNENTDFIPQKIPLSLRKEKFQGKLINIEGDEGEKLKFLEYWTATNEFKKMRFEDDPYFNIGTKFKSWIGQAKNLNYGSKPDNKKSSTFLQSKKRDYSKTSFTN